MLQDILGRRALGSVGGAGTLLMEPVRTELFTALCTHNCTCAGEACTWLTCRPRLLIFEPSNLMILCGKEVRIDVETSLQGFPDGLLQSAQGVVWPPTPPYRRGACIQRLSLLAVVVLVGSEQWRRGNLRTECRPWGGCPVPGAVRSIKAERS